MALVVLHRPGGQMKPQRLGQELHAQNEGHTECEQNQGCHVIEDSEVGSAFMGAVPRATFPIILEATAGRAGSARWMVGTRPQRRAYTENPVDSLKTHG
jgi:hypothetical protein